MTARSGTITEASVGDTASHDNLFCESEDEETSDEDSRLPEVRGSLNKWTNYLHGWQERFFVLKEGALMYYKSALEHAIDCRGALRLSNARVLPHAIDDCRFDVMVNESIWYLRASCFEERETWLQNLELHQRAASGEHYDGGSGLRVRRNSLISIHSGTTSRSTASSTSVKRTQALRLKLAEMDTFKDILCKQVDTLQFYFDACSSLVQEGDIELADEEEIHSEVVDGFGTFEDPEDLPASAGQQQTNATTGASTPPPASPQQNRGLLNRFLPSMFSGQRYTAPAEPPTDPCQTPKNGLIEPEMTPARLAHIKRQRMKDLEALLKQHGSHAVDFKGVSCIFKATAAGILTNLGHCIDLMQQREEYLRRRLEKEVERRQKIEEAYRHQQMVTQSVQEKMRMHGGPDCEEGPNCMMADEEFFDALEAQLDRMEEEEREARISARLTSISCTEACEEELSPAHPLFHDIDTTVKEHLRSTDFDVNRLMNDSSDGWELMVEEDEMKLFTRQATGLIPIDPMKAFLTIQGVTAKEVCTYFWDTAYRLEWEYTIEKPPTILDVPAQNTTVQHQAYKRVWPTVQREAVYWSHLCQRGDLWLVVNRSCEHKAPPLEEGKRVRLLLNVAMVCKMEPPVRAESSTDGVVTRDQLRCRMQYTAQLHPGGWAPRSIIRSVQRREFPNFLRRFSAYVQEKTKHLPIDR